MVRPPVRRGVELAVAQRLVAVDHRGLVGAALDLGLELLLGLLLGAVVGLWPFQEGVAPETGSTIKGRLVTEEVLRELEPEDYR